jgi:hypothetical protein
MARNRDYIPKNDFRLLEFAKNLLAYAKTKYTAWSVASPIPFLQTNITEYESMLEAAQEPNRGKVDVQNKNEWKRILTASLRTYIQGFLARNPKVTDEDRTLMGLPLRDTIRTPHETVSEMVEFDLRLRNIREVIVNFRVQGSPHIAKPDGYDGAVLIWDVLGAPPERPESLSRHTMASRTPHALPFDETERGSTVYVAAAWQNERGTIGAWSEIQNTVIP